MKAVDIKVMTVDQIDDEVLKLKKEQFNLRFQRATGQLENTSRVRTVRRDIARLLTVARQKREGEEPKTTAGAEAAPKTKSKAKTKSKSKSAPKRKAPAKRKAKG